MIPLPIIACCIFFSCMLNIIEVSITIFWFKHFRYDFYMFLFSTTCCIFFGLANGLLMSILFSLLLILKISSKPIWNIKNFNKIKSETKAARRSSVED
jgi:MFS superfamily sulfate permease-like transporter